MASSGSLSSAASSKTFTVACNSRICCVSSDKDLVFLDIVQKLRQVGSANEPLSVGAKNLVSVLPATDMTLDFSIVVFQIQSLHKLKFVTKNLNIDSAIGPRGF